MVQFICDESTTNRSILNKRGKTMKRIMDSSQRGSKTSNCVLAAVFALIAACAAKADTVVWYTFDDLGDVGTRISDSSTIQNKANPGTHNATVYGIKQGYIKDATSVNLPYVTNGVPEFTRMWDPVSGSSASGTDRALRFPSTNAGGQGALLEVETDASLRPESFTAEALFRYPDPNWNLDANGWNRLVVMPNDAGYAWEIVVKWHNQVGFHFMANDGSVTNRDWVVAPASGNWNDCMWHHVALSVEQGETTSTVKMYLDYALKATKTLNYRISYSSSNSDRRKVGTGLFRQLLRRARRIPLFEHDSDACPVPSSAFYGRASKFRSRLRALLRLRGLFGGLELVCRCFGGSREQGGSRHNGRHNNHKE